MKKERKAPESVTMAGNLRKRAEEIDRGKAAGNELKTANIIHEGDRMKNTQVIPKERGIP